MAESLITQHIDLWTSAIEAKSTAGRGSKNKFDLYGIKKLRELILELAVRGKLVPQDPTDEPASVLLEKIAVEKARLIKEKKIKKTAELPNITDEEKPFELPNGWEFRRFGNVTFNRDAERIPLSEDERAKRKGSYDYYGASGVIDSIDEFIFDKSLLLIGEDGANLVNRSTAIAFIAKGRYWVNNHAHVIDGITDNFLLYICLHINAISLLPYITGTAQPKMNQAKMNSILLGIPPEKEQIRIVAKVDELMALCDQLEQQTLTSIDAHAMLVKTLLETLTNSADVTELEQNWARISEHFDSLFTTEQSIDALKQTILQLAVMGKLVRQDPTDEPASVLLEKIAAEKAQLIKDKKIKKEKPLPPISDDEKPFELPQGWEWCRLPEIGELARGKSKHRPRNDPKLYAGGDIPLVQTGDVARADGIITTYTALYNNVGLEQSRLWAAGTMCITIAANIADTAILGFDACFPDSVVGFVPFNKNLNICYFDYYLRTAKSHLEDFAPATAQKNINLEILGELLVPLPPEKELNRIVTKVDQLFDIFEQINKSFKQSRQIQLFLTDAIIDEALN